MRDYVSLAKKMKEIGFVNSTDWPDDIPIGVFNVFCYYTEQLRRCGPVANWHPRFRLHIRQILYAPNDRHIQTTIRGYPEITRRQIGGQTYIGLYLITDKRHKFRYFINPHHVIEIRHSNPRYGGVLYTNDAYLEAYAFTPVAESMLREYSLPPVSGVRMLANSLEREREYAATTDARRAELAKAAEEQQQRRIYNAERGPRRIQSH